MKSRTSSVALVVDVVQFRAPLDEHLQAAESAVKGCGVRCRPTVDIAMIDVLRDEGSSIIDAERENDPYRSSAKESVDDEGIAVRTGHVKTRLIATVVSVEIDVVVDQCLDARIVTTNGGDVCGCPALGRLSVHVRVLPKEPMHALERHGRRRTGGRGVRTSRLPACAAQCKAVNLSSLCASTSLTFPPLPAISSSSLMLFARTAS